MAQNPHHHGKCAALQVPRAAVSEPGACEGRSAQEELPAERKHLVSNGVACRANPWRRGVLGTPGGARRVTISCPLRNDVAARGAASGPLGARCAPTSHHTPGALRTLAGDTESPAKSTLLKAVA